MPLDDYRLLPNQGRTVPKPAGGGDLYNAMRALGINVKAEGSGAYIGMDGWTNPGRSGVPYSAANQAQFMLSTGSFTPLTLGKPLYREGGAADGWLMSSANNQEFAFIQQALKSAGLIEGSYYIGERSDSKTQKAWDNLLSMANRTGVTWQTMLGRLSKSSSSKGGGGGPGGKGSKNPWGDGPRRVTTTSVNTTYRQTTREDAQAMLLDMWRNHYGRDPRNTEVVAFQRSLNAEQKKNPTVTTTRTTTDRMTGSSSSSTTVKEGADPSSMLLDKTLKASKASVESRAYKVGQYTDVLLRMVGLDAGAGEGL